MSELAKVLTNPARVTFLKVGFRFFLPTKNKTNSCFVDSMVGF